jgi:hypothetical protein
MLLYVVIQFIIIKNINKAATVDNQRTQESPLSAARIICRCQARGMKSDPQPTSHGRKARNKQGEGTGVAVAPAPMMAAAPKKHQRERGDSQRRPTAGGGFRGRDELPLWLLRWRRGFLANASSIPRRQHWTCTVRGHTLRTQQQRKRYGANKSASGRCFLVWLNCSVQCS